MQAPPILGGDRADTGADLLRQLRAEASGSAADALGRLGGARRFARVADLLHTALDGSTTPESFANIVAARARAADEQFFLSLAVALREAGALVETGAAAAAQRQRDVAARAAAWRADELQVADAERGRLRAEIARFDEEAAVLRDKLAFHARFDGGAEEEPMAADDAPTAAQLRLAVGHERAHAAHLALRAALDGERAEARQKRQMHVTRFAGKVEAAKGERAERRHAEKLEHLREQKRDEEGRQRDDRAWWTAAHARRREHSEAALADARRARRRRRRRRPRRRRGPMRRPTLCSASRRRRRRRATRSRAAACASR